MAANKCNITKFAKIKLNTLHWAISDSTVDKKIYENYLNFLNCDTVSVVNCYPDKCSNPVVNFTCSLSLSGISFTIEDRIITFYLAEGAITNGLPPYTYRWTYETADFIQTGDVDTESSILTLKEDKDFDLLVTKISVEVTDANECKTTKECYFVKGDIECAEDYLPCGNITNFRVRDSYVTCNSVTNFKVS